MIEPSTSQRDEQWRGIVSQFTGQKRSSDSQRAPDQPQSNRRRTQEPPAHLEHEDPI